MLFSVYGVFYQFQCPHGTQLHDAAEQTRRRVRSLSGERMGRANQGWKEPTEPVGFHSQLNR
jgi:hypothetical protein